MTAVVLWFTGLPAAGKTTLADAVAAALRARGLDVQQFDGDAVRRRRPEPLGFSRADRARNVLELARLAADHAAAGGIAIVSAVSPYRDARGWARALVERRSVHVEVHVATPLAECVRRDPKGLYAKAIAGELSMFTGISDLYEEPRHPDIRLDTTGFAPRAAVQQVVTHLDARDLLALDDFDEATYLPRRRHTRSP